MQPGKPDVGLGDYQVRGWRGWRHHWALVMMAMLFTLEERLSIGCRGEFRELQKRYWGQHL